VPRSDKGHTIWMPTILWEWAQRESGLARPGPWLRDLMWQSYAQVSQTVTPPRESPPSELMQDKEDLLPAPPGIRGTPVEDKWRAGRARPLEISVPRRHRWAEAGYGCWALSVAKRNEALAAHGRGREVTLVFEEEDGTRRYRLAFEETLDYLQEDPICTGPYGPYWLLPVEQWHATYEKPVCYDTSK
jgi:hypothetical protein